MPTEDPKSWYSALLEDAMSRVDFGRRIIRQNRENSDPADQGKKNEGRKQRKPQCPACGSDDYEGDLKACPYCGGVKCSFCDMGDDVTCASPGCEEA